MNRSPEYWFEKVGARGVRQAVAEMRGLADSFSGRGMLITASQLRCLCDLAEACIARHNPPEDANALPR